MKFTVETNVLNEALKKAGATLSQKDNTPLFRNFALKAKDDKLTIMSTDTDLATICVVPVTNVEEGDITIPGAKFQNIAKLTDSPNITVESEVHQSKCSRRQPIMCCRVLMQASSLS